MKKTPCKLGEIILLQLKEANMKQVELAKKCSVSKSHISHIISGANTPSLFLLMKISILLNCNIEDLVHAVFL